MNNSNEREVACSFCGKSQSEVKRIIAGPNVFICDECIHLCMDIIDEEDTDTDFAWEELPKPREIKDILDEYVIGQDEAKKALSVAVYNHYKRIDNRANSDDSVEIQKSNILMMGPTGSGKTMLAETLARILDVPFTIADATSLTEAGYVGEDVENVVLKLVQAADYDIERAERGIIYIDEIDKLTRKSANPSITRDVSGEGVQQALLKIIEGTIANVPPQGGRKHPQQEYIQVNTKDILFIVGGAFEGIEKMIETRRRETTMGFGADVRGRDERNVGEILKELEPEDLLQYGMIPEFVGRIPVVVSLDALDTPTLVRILTEPKNALVKQYKELFRMDGVELEFDAKALWTIAEKAKDRKTGARGLKSIVEEALLETMFEMPSCSDLKRCYVTKEAIEGIRPPTFVYEDTAEDTEKTESAS